MNLDPFIRTLAGLLHDLPPGQRDAILTVTRQLRRCGEFAGTEGRRAPVELTATCLTRLGPARVDLLSTALGIHLPAHELYLVPVASPEKCVGTLALLDSDGEGPDDRLMESYASRAAMAYLHAARLL